MCGRAAVVLTPADLAAAAGAPVPRLPAGYAPRPNVGPASTLPLVVGGGSVLPAVWGLPRPGGGGGGGGLLINARAESAASTPTWARLLARGPASRAVLVVNGYYEWKGAGAARKPHFVAAAGGGPLALAALVDASADPPRFAVLTTAPPTGLAFLHDRAPAMLGEAVASNPAIAAWLAGEAAPGVLAPYKGALKHHPVTREVGNVAYQGADCMADARKGGLAAAWARAGVKREAGASPAAGVRKEGYDKAGASPAAGVRKEGDDKAGASPAAGVRKEGDDKAALSPPASTPSPSPPKKKRGGQGSLDAFVKRERKG